jgi:hypothetical protein
MSFCSCIGRLPDWLNVGRLGLCFLCRLQLLLVASHGVAVGSVCILQCFEFTIPFDSAGNLFGNHVIAFILVVA